MKSEVLYLESDEEITSAIDKMLASDGDEIKIVVPKSSALLQSIVNQKLLKKAADDAGKSLILVTTDRISSHLAGRVGLAVASSLKAEAVVPESQGEAPSMESEVIEEAPTPIETAATSASEPEITPLSAEPTVSKDGGSKEPKVPNFGGLQKKVLIGIGVLLLTMAAYGANFFLKRATVTLFAQAERIESEFDFKIATEGGTDADRAIVAGEELSVNKEFSTKFAATGKKDVGTKAKGQMTVYNGYDANPRSFPAGSRFIASDGKVFRADSDFTVPGGSLVAGSISPGTTTVGVTADQAGDQYNLAPAKYNIPGQPAQVYGQGGQMSGGTTKEVTVVSQEDLDKAQTELLAQNKESAEKELTKKVAKGQKAIGASLGSNVGSVLSDPAVGAEATTATLTLKVTYSLLAVDEDDFAKVVEAKQLESVGDDNQIYDNGIEEAEITKVKEEDKSFHFSGEAYGGRKIDVAAIAKVVTGKKFGEAADIAADAPGVERATVKITPGWSSRLPRITKNIKVEIEVSK